MGFSVSLIVLFMLTFAVMYLPSDRPASAEYSSNIHNAFVTIVNFTPRMVFGSLLAYVISQKFDVWAFHKIKSITGDRWLWLRNNLSTLSSQVIDTTIFTLVVWAHIVGIRAALALGFREVHFQDCDRINRYNIHLLGEALIPAPQAADGRLNAVLRRHYDHDGFRPQGPICGRHEGRHCATLPGSEGDRPDARYPGTMAA